MTRPGDRLRALAARICSAGTMARLIDPVIADMQAEDAQARRDGRMWRSRWVRLAGYIALAKVLVVCESSAAGDTGPLVRAVVCSLGAVAVATAAFVAIPYYNQRGFEGFELDRWQTVMFLLPQALAISIPVGVTIGIAVGLARRQMSMRLTTLVAALAFVCSAGSAVNLGWVVPNANQALRTAAFRKFSQIPPPKGDNELTFQELNRQIRQSGTFPVDSRGLDEFTRLEVAYHMRWALAFATLVLALFAMSLVGWSRRRWAIGIGVGAAIFGYYALLFIGRSYALNHDLAPPVAAWLANAFFVAMSGALMALGARRRRDDEGLKATEG
jgi:hypothetical protein